MINFFQQRCIKLIKFNCKDNVTKDFHFFFLSFEHLKKVTKLNVLLHFLQKY